MSGFTLQHVMKLGVLWVHFLVRRCKYSISSEKSWPGVTSTDGSEERSSTQSVFSNSQSVSLGGFQNDTYLLSQNESRLPAVAAKSLQSCPTLCDPIDSSPPGSAAPGILQARTLERVAISFSSG